MKIDGKILTDDGEVFPFKTLDQLKSWVEVELKIWQQFEEAMIDFRTGIPNASIHRQYWTPIISDVVKCQIHPYQELLSYIENQSDQIEAAINSFNTKKPLISKSARGVKVLALFEEDKLVSFFLLCIWNSKCSTFSYCFQNMNVPDIRPLYVAKQKAFVEANFFEKGLKGTARVEKKALQNAKNDAESMLAEIAEKISESDKQISDNAISLENLDGKTDNFFKAKKKFSKSLLRQQIKELTKLKKLYTEELSLQIPVTYWKDKASNHRTAAFVWGGAFLVLIMVLIIGAPTIFHQIIEGLKIVDDEGAVLFDVANNPYSLLFALTFPTFLAIWVLRILSRNIIANFNHMYDSQNRAVMTETFLALMSEGKATDNDRILILNALFQPMNSSSDDGAPPHWFELMMERVKKS